MSPALSRSVLVPAWRGARLALGGTISIEENSVGAQVTDECVQVVCQLLIAQQSSEQSLPMRRFLHDLGGGLNGFARINQGGLHIIRCFFCGTHGGVRLFEN